MVAPDLTETAYDYDEAGNLVSRTDARGNTTTYAYDEAGRLVEVTNPVGSVWTYTWDEVGNLVEVTDANGNATPAAGDGVTAFSYDELDRLVAVGYSDATPDAEYSYDEVGNLVQMTDGAGVETYDHDDLGRLVEVARGTDAFSYAWDDAGQLARRTYPDSTQVDLDWDEDGRLVGVAVGADATAYAYDAAGNLTEAAFGNGTTEERAYDRAGRVTEVRHEKGTASQSVYQYQYDGAGNPTRMDAPEGVTTYHYDDLDRLVEACFDEDCPLPSSPAIRWTYDAVGNRTGEERPEGTTTYAYDAADRLLTLTDPQQQVTEFAHDANGNMTEAGDREMAYDLAGRMISLTEGGSTTAYGWDGAGKRISAATGSSTTEYLWDVTSPLPELVLERDGGGPVIRRYVYGADLDRMTTGGSTYRYHHDGLGSVVGLTDSVGDRAADYAYEPFGALRTSVPPAAPENPMRFTGEYLDPSGLYHLRARQYDPNLGRFTRPDPLESLLSDPYVGSYVYAGNMPTVVVDPSGLRGQVTPGMDSASIYVWGGRAIKSLRWVWRVVRRLVPFPPDLPAPRGPNPVCYGLNETAGFRDPTCPSESQLEMGLPLLSQTRELLPEAP